MAWSIMARPARSPSTPRPAMRGHTGGRRTASPNDGFSSYVELAGIFGCSGERSAAGWRGGSVRQVTLARLVYPATYSERLRTTELQKRLMILQRNGGSDHDRDDLNGQRPFRNLEFELAHLPEGSR